MRVADAVARAVTATKKEDTKNDNLVSSSEKTAGDPGAGRQVSEPSIAGRRETRRSQSDRTGRWNDGNPSCLGPR